MGALLVVARLLRFQARGLRAMRARSTFFMELPMVRKNYAPDENAPRQPYADKDAGVGMGRLSLDDDDDFEDDLDDEEEDDDTAGGR
ncbi:hypothetical protein H3V53_33695 [Paraburkholderia bengalensis]|jgi:hypothetical protein|uniref:Uncharacterized protein n=1 Tax=Paraburkholderia bengalensis TaxID=2747562 RepID=A0ABU8J1U5_9BURK